MLNLITNAKQLLTAEPLTQQQWPTPLPGPNSKQTRGQSILDLRTLETIDPGTTDPTIITLEH